MSVDRLLRKEHRGYYLAKFLNEEEDEATRTDVLKIFELCRKLDELHANAFRNPAASVAAKATKLAEYGTKTPPLRKFLNDALDKFQFRPRLIGFSSYEVAWMPMADAGSEPGTIPSAGVVQIILGMTAAGALGRIRQCICGRWFFAQTKKKLVCSDACRFQKFKQGNQETFNKERAAYMRMYRNNPRVRAKRKQVHGKTKTRTR